MTPSGGSSPEILPRGGGATLAVKVTPRAKKYSLGGVVDGALVVKVTEPPLDDRANEAVLAFLARALKVRPGAVTLLAGSHSRRKVIFIEGLSPAALLKKLSPMMTGEEITGAGENSL